MSAWSAYPDNSPRKVNLRQLDTLIYKLQQACPTLINMLLLALIVNIFRPVCLQVDPKNS